MNVNQKFYEDLEPRCNIVARNAQVPTYITELFGEFELYRSV